MERPTTEQPSVPARRKKMTKQLTGKRDDTPLHSAARAGNLAAVKEILTGIEEDALKEQLAKQNQSGETALYVAAEYGYVDLVKEMINYYDLVNAGIKARNGFDALHIAAKQGDLDILKVLLAAHPELAMTVDLSNTTALHTAATQGHIENVKFLLEVGSSLAIIARSNGKTPLHSAARNGHLDVVKALLACEPGIAPRIDKKGQTALHMAVKGQSLAVVEELIRVNPSLMINMVDTKGNTSLHIATRKGRAQIVKLLLGYKETDIKAVNRCGETAFDIAEKTGHLEIASMLQQHGVQSARAIKPAATNPARELKQTVSDIKHEVHYQLEHTLQTRKQVQGIAKRINKMHSEGLNNAINSTTVVAVLIATVAFAAIFTVPGQYVDFDIVLVDNPVCQETGAEANDYCSLPQPDSSSVYTTPPMNCVPNSCGTGQISSPRCICAYPYTGTLQFRGLYFSNLRNETPYESLEQNLTRFFRFPELLVDTVSLSNPRMDQHQYLLLDLYLFPYGQDRFNRSGISKIASALSSQDYKPPEQYFGPYVFTGAAYEYFSDGPAHSNKSSAGIAIGAAVGASVLFILLVIAGIYAYRQRKRADRATKESNPFAHWDPKKSSGSIPQLKGARCFSFEELKKYTKNFSEANDIGSGGYGKVYRGTLPTGELVAIKRAQQGSMQGGLEFKTEIELLSRVHHKNVVSLLGFCFERGEQMLVYEYIPNGSLSDSLSGKSGIRLDWPRRLKIALGAAKGVAYLHELANPPIIHRDIKSTNILLDERLNAKVADFGLSKPMGDSEKGHVSTQVKGTMGYLDPEYYMTQQLTEKSDVYSFGVLMLEIITARRPIERGKYIVREMRMSMDKTKSLYNLQQILDPAIGFGTSSKGLERFVELAMRCVEESGTDRPTMGEVVKEIENIMQMDGMNPNAESASSSATYEDATKGADLHPYDNDSFAYSGAFPHSAAKIEPH